MDNVIYNLLNSSLGIIGVVSFFIMFYGLIRYSLALTKNNKNEEVKARKISVYSGLVLIITATAYSILLI